MSRELHEFSEKSDSLYDVVSEAMGESEAFLSFQSHLSHVAQVNRPILIMGERGTGKELAAARLHYLSLRWQNPLITLNCAALAPSLLEAELFGHESGAFTGANRLRQGRFEVAHQGSLFLDEIGLIPMVVQEKILRVVEYSTFERLGSSEAIRVDVRIIGATNANLPAMAAQGQFKMDLLDRLSFEVLHLPPLRDRHGDIPLLARHFARRMANELGRSEPPQFSNSALQSLERHEWPGNIRELKNVVERAVYKCNGSVIRSIQFNPFASGITQTAQPHPHNSKAADEPFSLPKAIHKLELDALSKALSATRHHQGNAASFLGLTYHQFRALYRRHQKNIQEQTG
jgi:psp operon transcriptional activator